MAQTIVNIRMDADLKRDVEKVYSEMGLSMTRCLHSFPKNKQGAAHTI